jgi:hypothetical protein
LNRFTSFIGNVAVVPLTPFDATEEKAWGRLTGGCIALRLATRRAGEVSYASRNQALPGGS